MIFFCLNPSIVPLITYYCLTFLVCWTVICLVLLVNLHFVLLAFVNGMLLDGLIGCLFCLFVCFLYLLIVMSCLVSLIIELDHFCLLSLFRVLFFRFLPFGFLNWLFLGLELTILNFYFLKSK